MVDIAKNLQQVQKQITRYCEQYHRDPHSVSLLAISKTHSVAEIQAAIDAGQKAFGENYVQEALEKMIALGDQQLTWHFVGTIQRNKTAVIAKHFSWIHSVDRLDLAKRLHQQRPPHLPPLNICIQVNLDDETQKAGVSLTALPALVTEIKMLSHLKLRGLMIIPKADKNFAEQRATFAKLRQAAEQLQLTTLSMGMSEDFEAAIAEGATIVRIGTAIFGPRS